MSGASPRPRKESEMLSSLTHARLSLPLSLDARRVLSLCLISLLLAGCGREDLDSCSTQEFATPTFEVVSGLEFDDANNNVVIRGILQAEERYRLIRIAGIPGTGTEDNFGQWSVTVPRAVLETYRNGREARLPVIGTVSCGRDDILANPLVIPLTAPSGTDAPGLRVEVEMPDGTCFL